MRKILIQTIMMMTALCASIEACRQVHCKKGCEAMGYEWHSCLGGIYCICQEKNGEHKPKIFIKCMKKKTWDTLKDDGVIKRAKNGDDAALDQVREKDGKDASSDCKYGCNLMGYTNPSGYSRSDDGCSCYDEKTKMRVVITHFREKATWDKYKNNGTIEKAKNGDKDAMKIVYSACL